MGAGETDSGGFPSMMKQPGKKTTVKTRKPKSNTPVSSGFSSTAKMKNSWKSKACESGKCGECSGKLGMVPGNCECGCHAKKAAA